MTVKEIEKEILRLGASEKAEILRLLISELDEERDDDVDRVWLEEA